MSTDYRSEFDIPRDVCYLNACYMTPQPRAVLDAAVHGARYRSEPWRIMPQDFFARVETLRSSFARQVGCAADNIAIVPSAGYGVSCAALNLPLSRNGLVLTMEDQFPSNYYAWRRHALESGAEFEVVAREPGQSWAEAFLAAIEKHGDRIDVATLEGHHWSSADVIDLESIIPLLRDAGAGVVLDLTQTVGAFPVDVRRLAPDFMVTAGYKWQFCPYGVGFLYVDDAHFDGVSVEEPWMGRDGAEDFSRLAEFTDRYQAGARRFDVSEKSSFSNVEAAIAALGKLDEWGIASISQTLAETNLRLADILATHGFTVAAPETRAPHFQGARIPATDPRQLATTLNEHGIYASVRGEHLRVAPHVYTDDGDLERFDAALGAALS